MKAMRNIFSKSKNKMKKQQVPSETMISSLEKLHVTIESFEKQEDLIQKKISSQDENIKEYMKLGNKKAAMLCLKKKKLYEKQLEQLGNLQLKTQDQMLTLEGTKAATETIDALKAGSAAAKAIQNSLNVDDIVESIEEANEVTEDMKQIQEALATSVGFAQDFDEDELEAELQELEDGELEEQLLQLPSIPPAANSTQIPHGEAKLQLANDVEKLAARQAEISI